MPEYRRVAFKPGDHSTSLALTSDGRLIPRGDVVDPEVDHNWDGTDGLRDLGRDLVVTDWAEPAGYVLDGWGGIHAFGSATPATPAGSYTAGQDVWRALVMDPAGNGNGYKLRSNGTIVAFGPSPPTALTGPSLAPAIARDLEVEWATKKAMVLDGWGVVHAVNGATKAAGYSFYQRGWDIARALDVVDWAAGHFVVLDGFGGVWTTTAGPELFGAPYWRGWDIARDVVFETTSPSVFRVLDGQGGIHKVEASTAPTVSVVEPADEDAGTAGNQVTSTTRPTVAWSYDDAEGDTADRYELRIFTDAQYGAGGFDPSTSDATYERTFDDTRVDRHEVTEALANDTYRAYVRARERGTGLWSAWANRQWTQVAVRYAAPTLAATAQPATARVQLVVSGAVPAGAETVEVEASYDAGGTWEQVRTHSDAERAAANPVTLWDREAPLNTAALYRARYISADPHVDGDWSAHQPATIDAEGYWLSVPESGDDPDRVKVSTIRLGRHVEAHTAWPIGAVEAVVVHDGVAVRGHTANLALEVLSAAERATIDGLLDDGRPLLMRDHLGRRIYAAITDGVGIAPVRVLDDQVDLSLTEVARPAV